MARRFLREAALVAAFALVYFATAKLGLRLAVVHSSATAVWAPSGIALAALLVFGGRIWPGILLGAFVANALTTGTWLTSLAIASGNTLEAMLGAYCVRRFAGGIRAFERPPTVFAFTLLAGMLATLVSPLIGITTLALAGYARWSQFGTIGLTWWLGDASGVLVVTPFLVLWGRPQRVPWNAQRALEATLLVTVLVAIGLAVFTGPRFGQEYFPLKFLTIPVLVWAAFRFTQREAVTATLLLSAIAVTGFLSVPPQDLSQLNRALLVTQSFMAVISVLVLATTAALTQTELIGARVRELNRELEERVGRRTRQLVRANRRLQRQARERASVQAELERSELRLREAQQVARMGGWEWDIARDIVWWSAELYELYGLDPERFEASFAAFLERVHPDDRQHVQKAVQSALEAGQPFVFEHRIVRPDGAVLTLLARGRVLSDAGGRPLRIIGTGQDITERRRAEEERSRLTLEQAARREAENANRLKDEFLAALSHELRTPLNAIVGWAHILREGRLDAASTAHAIEIIDRNAQIQSHLIADILDVSRMAFGQLELRTRTLRIATVVESAAETVGPSARAKGTLLSLLLDPSVTVKGDADRLQQVMWNLLSNAIKFSPPGARIEVSLARAASGAEIRVEDEGPGIDPEFLPFIFDRFRQQDSSVTRKHGGLGLGLGIVRHLVELHGGSVSAANRDLRHGAVFTVVLPLASPDDEIAPDAPASSHHEERALAPEMERRGARLAGLDILFVEDDADSRELLAALLSAEGAQVTAVESCRAALSALERERPDLLISDIGMPDEDGYDLIAQVRAQPQSRSLPAIALTAYAGAENVKKALDAGFDQHLAKPVPFDELVRQIGALTRAATGC